MTHNARESSREDGQPISLMLIRYGSAANSYYAYTNHEEAVTFGGVTYKPIPVDHDGIKRTLTLDATRMTLTTPSKLPLAARWRSFPPSEVISMTIRQGHVGETEFPVVWLGRLLGSKDKQDGTTEFSCEPRHTALLRSGLNRNDQYGCMLLLYSQGEGLCNANKAAATSQFTVGSTNGPLVVLDGSWNALGDARLDYINGTVEWETADNQFEVRTIIAVAGSGEISLNGPATGMLGGQTVNVVLGCRHLTDDCERLHNNILNYGGDPYIPLQNPIGIKNSFR